MTKEDDHTAKLAKLEAQVQEEAKKAIESAERAIADEKEMRGLKMVDSGEGQQPAGGGQPPAGGATDGPIEARLADIIDKQLPGDTPGIIIHKIDAATKIYTYVIWFLGLIVLIDIGIIGVLLYHGPTGSATAVVIPDGLIAIGSAAVGAIAGILAQPTSK
jgi:hypothetical protein